jgi:ParB-like chromosome segregation protein Spo0J
MITYEFHPIAEIFPMLEEEDLKALAEDIKAKGLREPITLYDGKVLDGRNRYRACELAEVELWSDQFIQYEGDDALGFVISKNLRRRHLNESQRAMVAAKIANMTVGGDHSANLQKGHISQSKAAELMNVSTRSVATAKTIEDPDIQDAVLTGKKSVHAASKEQQARGTPKKARGTTKKGSAGKSSPSIDDIRKSKMARTRKLFWTAFLEQLAEALTKTYAAIDRFETDPEGRPEKDDWYLIATQLSNATQRLHDLHTGKVTE